MIKNITVIGASAGIGFETVKRVLASNQPTVEWLAEQLDVSPKEYIENAAMN